jgi:aldehyde:ferredoxin oxidoreductase
MGKSPKTKNLNDSFCGGTFSHILGKTGYDGIIIKGKAKKPVYISVDNGKVQILPAEDLWGLDPKQVEEKIAKVQKGASVACIGIAGENLGMQSCIMVDKNRSVGLPAYGAIMGSKKLKAVVVSGNQKKVLADVEKFNALKKEFAKKVADSGFPKNLKQFGTAQGVEFFNDSGMLPT